MLQMFAHPAEFNFPHHHPRRQQQQLLQQQQQQQQQQPPQQQQQQPVQGSPSSLFSPASSSSAPTTFHSACKKRPLYFEPEFLAALDSSLTDSPNAGASSPSAADSISPNPTVGRPTKKVKKNVAVSKTPLGRAINPLDRAYEPSSPAHSVAAAPTMAPNEAPFARQRVAHPPPPLNTPFPSRNNSTFKNRHNASTSTTSTHTKHKDTQPLTSALQRDPSPNQRSGRKKISKPTESLFNSAVTGAMGSAQGTTTETTRAGPSIIDLSSGEELVALHLGENEHKRRRDSTCSVSSNSFQDTYPRSGGPSTTTTTTTTESLREVFDVQDDGTLLPVWDHAPAMPSQKKKVKLDGRAASPLRSLEHDQDFVAQNMSNGWRGGHGANDDDDDDDAIGHDSTVFGSKAGGYFRRFSTTTTTTGHGLSSPLDTSSASPRPMDMGPYRDGSSTTNRHDSWRHHHRPGQSRYSAEQDGWLGDDETPSQHHHHNVNNDHSRPKTGSSAKKVEGNWALVKHSGTRVSLVSGVDELLKSHPTSCLNTINDNSTSSSSSTSAHQQLVLYRRPPLYAAAMVEELDEEDEEDEKRAAVETVRGRHRHRRSTGVVIEEIGDDDEGALADDEHSTRPRRGGARIHELDADDDLEMDAEDEQEEGEGDLTAPRSHNRIVPSDFNTDQAVHDIEAQIMSMDLD